MDHVGWLDRVEGALKELGWSGRELSRRAGLKNESQFAVTSRRIRTKARAQPSAMVVDGVTSALVRAGYSERWLRTGAVDPRGSEGSRQAPERAVIRDERQQNAAEARRHLLGRGEKPRDVDAFFGNVMFDESKGQLSALGLVELYDHRRAEQRGKAVGDVPVGDDEF